jgi:uncharacterized protein (DUF2062 family)
MKKPRPMSTSPSSTLLRTAVTSTSWRFTRTCGWDAAKALVTPDDGWWRGAVRRVLGVGKPLMLGLAILATAFGLATYFVVSALWKVSVLWKRHRRLCH